MLGRVTSGHAGPFVSPFKLQQTAMTPSHPRLRRDQCSHGGGARQPAGEPDAGQAGDGQEQDPTDAGGIRRPSAAHRSAPYPAERYKRVVLIIDNAPWYRGRPIDKALAESPHLEFYRLPSYNPHLNVIERFWRVLRRRATHNRLFDRLADLKQSVRNSVRYFQTVRGRVGAGRQATPAPQTGQHQRACV